MFLPQSTPSEAARFLLPKYADPPPDVDRSRNQDPDSTDSAESLSLLPDHMQG